MSRPERGADLACMDTRAMQDSQPLGEAEAWRCTCLLHMWRNYPDLDAALLFDADEIALLYALSGTGLPVEPPTLDEVLRLLAVLELAAAPPCLGSLWAQIARALLHLAGERRCA